LWASQVAPANENGLRLRVYGTKGGLHGCKRTPTSCAGRRRRADAASSPAAPRLGRGGGARSPHARRPSEAILKASPTSIPKSRWQSKRRARAKKAARRMRISDHRRRRQSASLRRGGGEVVEAQAPGEARGEVSDEERARRAGSSAAPPFLAALSLPIVSRSVLGRAARRA